MKELRSEAGSASTSIVIAKAAFALVFFASAGLWAASRAYQPLNVWWLTNQCVHTTAQITDLYEYKIPESQSATHQVLWSSHIEFQFPVDGKLYKGNNYAMRNIYPTEGAAAKSLDGYQVNDNISICYMPRNPRASWPSSFAIPLRTVMSNLGLLLIGAILIALGILIPIRWAKETLSEN